MLNSNVNVSVVFTAYLPSYLERLVAEKAEADVLMELAGLTLSQLLVDACSISGHQHLAIMAREALIIQGARLQLQEAKNFV